MTGNCYICRNAIQPFDWTPGYIVDCPYCGKYQPSGLLLQQVFSTPRLSDHHIYSGAVRELYEQSGREVWVEDLSVLLASVSIPKNPIEKIDRLLIHVAQKTISDPTPITYEIELYPVAYARNKNELYHLIGMAKDEGGYLKTGGVGESIFLTMNGWQRVEEVSKVRRESAQAFVAMSFSKPLFEAWKDGFYPALNEVGYDPIRVDTEPTNHRIDNKIIADIRKSGLVVADFTEQKNGVYYEAGFAEGLGINVIYSCRDTDLKNLHFDTRQYNHIVWTNVADLKEKLINRVEATLPNRPRLSKISWELLS